MKSSKFLAPSKPDWQPFSYNIPKVFPKPGRFIKKSDPGFANQTNENILNDQQLHRSRRTLSFRRRREISQENNNRNITHKLIEKQGEQQNFEKSIKRRNLQVSKPLQYRQSNPLAPKQILLSEMQASYRIPGKEKPIPIRHSGYRTIFDKSSKTEQPNPILYHRGPGGVDEEFHSFDSDAVNKIESMKTRLLAGHHVSSTDIAALRVKLGFRHYEDFESLDHFNIPSGVPQYTHHRGHQRRRRVVRKPIFSNKGIVVVPTPHTTHPGMNSFGTPADLRISLSDTDTAEYNRRRFYFDFTGFLDEDIKLYLEGTRRLVIRGDRPERSYEKPALRVTDFIDLPKDLPVDNLRIVRDVFGTLIVEEAWKFV